MTSPFQPDPDQERVLAHNEGALLVAGGPGTGKTAVLRERFARLLESGADPERVALVVGSRRAQAEARDALLARFQGSLPELRVVTIHGLARLVLNTRFRRLDYTEPPDLFPAGDQFALVQELLTGQEPADWPAYGHMLGMRAFADEVRQFLSRAQEALLTPEDIQESAEKAGLTGWMELARFYREYQDVIDGRNVVDFAALLQRAAQVAGDGETLLDHLLVDDYQDTTFAAEAIVEGLASTDLVVAGDPEAHVFSFQGTTDIPILRFTERLAGAKHVALATSHRAVTPVVVEAWSAPHTSEEHAAIARELRRLARGGRRAVERARGDRQAAELAPGLADPRPRRRRRAARAPRRRHGAHSGAGELPLCAGLALAHRERRGSRAADRVGADVGSGAAVPGGGAWTDARGAGRLGHDRGGPGTLPSGSRRPRPLT